MRYHSYKPGHFGDLGKIEKLLARRLLDGVSPEIPMEGVDENLLGLASNYDPSSGISPYDAAPLVYTSGFHYSDLLDPIPYYDGDEAEDGDDSDDESLEGSKSSQQDREYESAATKEKDQKKAEIADFASRIPQLGNLHIGGERLVRARNGPIRRIERMRSFNQFKDITHKSRIDPLFDLKFAQKTLRVVARYKRTGEGKIYVVGVDQSGSMSGWRTTVQAILWKIKELAQKEKASVAIFGFLEHPVFKRFFEPEHMLEFEDYIVNYRGKGGCFTKVGQAVQMVLEAPDFDGHDLGRNVEFLLVNDGQDTVDKPFLAKTHGISLKQENIQLMRNCRDSGGTFVLIQ